LIFKIKIYMRKISMIEESLYEFAKRGRKPGKRGRKPKVSPTRIDATDKWDVPEDEDEVIDPDEFDVDTSDMEGADEIEVEEDVFDDKLFKALSNEVKVSEPNRRFLTFRLKGNADKLLQGIPMAKMGNNAFVFKLQDGKLKKIFLRDIILEQEKAGNRAKMVSEYSEDTNSYDWVPFSKMGDDKPRKNREEDHDCLENVDKNGRCRICGKWYRPRQDDI